MGGMDRKVLLGRRYSKYLTELTYVVHLWWAVICFAQRAYPAVPNPKLCAQNLITSDLTLGSER